MPSCVARRTSPRIDRAAGEIEPHRLAVGDHARQRAGSSSTARALLRHQRSSPRGSLGTSHSNSHKWLRGTACGASAR